VLERLDEAKNRFDRPAWLSDEIEISITPPKPLTKAMMEDYAALGVHRLISMLGFYPQETVLEDIEALATALDITD